MQVYSYKDYDIPASEGGELISHESGFVTAISNETANEYLHTCGRMHVLPIFVILRHHESHFTGVQHGDLFLQWQAEGDPSYAAEIADPPDCVHEYLTPLADTRVNLLETESPHEIGFEVYSNGRIVPLREDSEAVNTVLWRVLTMRQRLDVAHYRMGWPILDDAEYQVEAMEQLMYTAERRMYEAAGVDPFATGTRATIHDECASGPKRHQLTSRSRMLVATYQELLRTASADDLTPAHSIKLEAVEIWYRKERGARNLHRLSTAEISVSRIVQACQTQVESLRGRFAYLPYPELAAKELEIAQLLEWGNSEDMISKKSALERLAVDPSLPVDQQEYCVQWIREADVAPAVNEWCILADATRWSRFREFVEPEYVRVRPPQVPDVEWAILHVLLFIIRRWGATTMGRTPLTALAPWYTSYPVLQILCAEILDGDWSAATTLQNGLTWEEWEDTGRYPPTFPSRK
ncbi:hypothetical protein V7S43_012929 [Phytophthora oleae]|uniref:Uncharacterized protein n=1 Tax=Phytophthora oleae TaxID=2107226 RepID=A0ABD3F5Y5_9STRA